MPTQNVLELFSIPPEVLKMPLEERAAVVRKLVKTSGPNGFPKDAHAHKAAIPLGQEIFCMVVMGLCIGGPLLTFFTGVYLALFGSWASIGVFAVVVVVLVLHPLPDISDWLNRQEFTIWMYRYFSYRIMWTEDALDVATANEPWLGAAGPHGVMPFGNLLSMPAIKAILGKKFVGAAASVVFNAPLLRYLTLLGATDVSAKSIQKAMDKGYCVGLNPDGIAGIFQTSREKEVVLLKNRKGLAKFALKTGYPLCPAYSVGNTDCFYLWFDPLGILETLSRKVQAALMIYWGRLGLPIPMRANVTLLFAPPIIVQKKDEKEITQADIDEVHEKLMSESKKLFDEHKDALGYGHKEMSFI